MTGHWLAAAIQTPEQIHLAWPAPSPAQPRSGVGVKLSTAVHRVDTIGGACSGSVVPGRRLTARRSHDLETRSWKLEFRIMNCSQQSSVVWTQFLHSNQNSGSKVVISTLGLSLQALSLCSFIFFSRITFIYEASIAPFTSLQNLQRLILLISMGMDAVQSLNLCQGCRLLGM